MLKAFCFFIPKSGRWEGLAMRLRTSWYMRLVLQERVTLHSCTHHQLPGYVADVKAHKQTIVSSANSHQSCKPDSKTLGLSYCKQWKLARQESTELKLTAIMPHYCYQHGSYKYTQPKMFWYKTSLVFLQGSVMVNLSCINEPHLVQKRRQV